MVVLYFSIHQTYFNHKLNSELNSLSIICFALHSGYLRMNAIGHVTRKTANIIFAVLRDRTPYYVPDLNWHFFYCYILKTTSPFFTAV